MKFGSIGPIAIHLPELVEDNDLLARLNPRWDMDLIYAKTGIRQRHIASEGECASDLGVAAAEKLFAQYDVDRNSIDFLLLCTQTPDAPLPTTACLMQDRLGLPTSAGALDFNLGCSGFVYGLALADGLIRSGAAQRILFITAETYSKYIDPADRALRPIFGDGAAATLVEAAAEPSLGPFVFGTDGRGAGALMLTESSIRPPGEALQPSKRKRWPSNMFMDGPALVKFTLDVIPPLIEELLGKAKLDGEDIDLFLVHQATSYMTEHLRTRLHIPPERMPEALNTCGNTVSSTLPVLIRDLRKNGGLRPGIRSLQIGFGVGLSWGGCSWTETFAEKPHAPNEEAQTTGSSRSTAPLGSNGEDDSPRSRDRLPKDQVARTP